MVGCILKKRTAKQKVSKAADRKGELQCLPKANTHLNLTISFRKSYAQIHNEYGVSSTALSKWVKLYSEVKIDDDTVITAQQIKELQKRNAQLEDENLTLVPASAGPVSCNVCLSQVEHFEQAVIVREYRPVF